METKSEPASAYRLRQARRHGDVPWSSVLSAGTAGLALVLSVVWFGRSLVEGLGLLLLSCLRLAANPRLTVDGLAIDAVLNPLVGTILVFLTVGFVGAFLQVGPLFSVRTFRSLGTRVSFRWSEVLRPLLLVVVVGGMWFGFVYFARQDLAVLTAHRPMAIAEGMSRVVTLWLALLAALLLGLGVLDRVWARHLWLQRLRMSRKEVRDEQRLLEGDPRFGNYRRSAHRRTVEASIPAQGRGVVRARNRG